MFEINCVEETSTSILRKEKKKNHWMHINRTIS